MTEPSKPNRLYQALGTFLGLLVVSVVAVALLKLLVWLVLL